jgi:hypothetical protein
MVMAGQCHLQGLYLGNSDFGQRGPMVACLGWLLGFEIPIYSFIEHQCRRIGGVIHDQQSP